MAQNLALCVWMLLSDAVLCLNIAGRISDSNRYKNLPYSRAPASKSIRECMTLVGEP